MDNVEKIEFIKKSFELKNLKKYKEAIAELYKALECSDDELDNADIFHIIGDNYMLLRNYEKAIEEYERALSYKKNNIDILQKLYSVYFEMGNYSKALKIAQTQCELEKSALTYLNYIKVLIKNNETENAISVFNSLDEKYKLNPDILYLISTISGNKRKIILEKIVSIDENHQDANIDLAKIEYEQENYSKVIKYCLNLDDDNIYALYYLALVEVKRNNFMRAIELLNKAILFDGNKHDFYLDLAKIYIDIAWLDEALVLLKKSINYSLINQELGTLDEKYFLSAWIMIKQNKDKQALININSINKNSKYYSKIQILQQLINLKNSNLSEAKNVLEKYIDSEKNNLILLDTLAMVYKELKLYSKSIEVYKKAQKINPNSIYYSLEIIDLYIDNKEYDEAMKIIEEVKTKYSNCANIYNSLARIYYRLKDLDLALNSINQYLELDKNNAEAYYFKGLILNDLERYHEAGENIYAAIKSNPTIAKYYYQMARCYYNLSEYQNALLYVKEAIEINEDEITYKKLAYDIALKMNNNDLAELYNRQLRRSEEILKLQR